MLNIHVFPEHLNTNSNMKPNLLNTPTALFYIYYLLSGEKKQTMVFKNDYIHIANQRKVNKKWNKWNV